MDNNVDEISQWIIDVCVNAWETLATWEYTLPILWGIIIAFILEFFIAK